ncbi:MAG: aryldialkylphosphatase [Candidatus Brockarchaeota archaeon]|nr:aryldialkylphosphatase [Candidatus Brockarchaeota archaeon]
MGRIRTVLGDIPPEDFGLALVHEHVMCDFVGAEKVSKDRYDAKEVRSVMLPYLEEIRRLGVSGFVDCTPAFLGRDAELLADLSKASKMHVLTNTGLYKEPYLPKCVWDLSVDRLAEAWVEEIEQGIDGTPIKAGFIKIAVNPGKIVPIQQKIVRAAALCSASTGAAIACHTENGEAAMHVLEILEGERADLSRLIVVHCDSEDDQGVHREIAYRGAWIEYDGVREENAEKILRMLKFVEKEGLENRLLLSQDAGWYNVGEDLGGKIRGYAYLVREFLPKVLDRGFGEEFAETVMRKNPAEAFQMK